MDPNEPSRFEVRQVDVAYTAAIDPPAFDLGARWTDLQSAIYAHLGRFKLRLGDIKVETATANPGDLSIACWILDYGAVVRYRLDRVEAWSNRPWIAQDTALAVEIVKQTMQVLRDVSPQSHVAAQNLNFAFHGLLGNQMQVLDLIASYVTRRPQGGPPLIPNGVSFLCESQTGEGQGSVVLERSALVPNGVFLRVVSEYAGSLSEVDAVNRAIEFFRASTTRLGLNIEWGS